MRSSKSVIRHIALHDGPESFSEYLAEARGQQGERTAPYLLGTPRLGDHLEEGLEKLGLSTAELESEAE